jgi:hypothetical protein
LRFHSKRVAESESDSATPMTQIGLKKQTGALKKALSAATVDTRGYEEAIEVRRPTSITSAVQPLPHRETPPAVCPTRMYPPPRPLSIDV